MLWNRVVTVCREAISSWRRVLSVARRVQALIRPVVVVDFNISFHPAMPTTAPFLDSYQSCSESQIIQCDSASSAQSQPARASSKPSHSAESAFAATYTLTAHHIKY